MSNMNSKASKHVYVGMSGGVDSSVAAALLVKQGWQVTGVHLRLWDQASKDNHNVTLVDQSLEHASQVAALLNIPFQVIDATTEFRRAVVDYFINAHKKGETPNPCFVCNRLIKWGLFLDIAKRNGAEKLASGHYARIAKRPDGLIELYRAKDLLKDQSYVLASLLQEQLANVLFPLGDLTKSETREIARSYNFKIRTTEESQDLCFLEGQSQEEFLKRYAPDLFEKGAILNVNGQVIGEHNGLVNYTIGQRKGIKLSHPDPLYVLEKDVNKNIIIVGTRDSLGKQIIRVENVNWILGREPQLPARFDVKIRYQSAFYQATISKALNSGYDILFDGIVRDPTPGQYAVFYQGDMVIGSGLIIRAIVGEQS